MAAAPVSQVLSPPPRRGASRAATPSLTWRNPAGTAYSTEPEVRILLQRPDGFGLRLQTVPAGAGGYAVSRPPIDLHVLILSQRVRNLRYEAKLAGQNRKIVAERDGYSLLPAGSDSEFYGREGNNLYAVAIMRPDWLTALARRHDLPDVGLPVEAARYSPAIAALSATLREAVAAGAASPGYLDHWGLLAGLAMLRLHRPPDIDHAARMTRLSAPMLARVIERIEAGLDEEIGLDELASLVDLSPWHFARCFRAATGMPPHAYVTQRRLERAKLLLRDGLFGLSEVALACGFASQSHFTTAFRRDTGLPPGRWRLLAGQLLPADG